MALRKVILTVHLVLGLISAIFLIVLGLTGSVLAFERDIIHWSRPSLWYVTPQTRALSEDELVSTVHNAYPTARVFAVRMYEARNLAQLMQLSDGTIVYVNPYDGTILGDTVGLSNAEQTMLYAHRIHQALVPEPESAPNLTKAGKLTVSIAGLLLCLQVPMGVFLWWRNKRTSITWKGPWFRAFGDAHHIIGICAAFFLVMQGFTGILIGFDAGSSLLYGITRSSSPPKPQSWPSTPDPHKLTILPDQVLATARRALPGATVSMIIVPARQNGSFTVMMRVPGETSETVHSTVTIDQYTGQVLNVRDYRKESAGYRLIRFNRSLHTGDIFGFPSRILLSLSSLALVAMTVTGLVIWRKKLAE
jgi:uncharacterized iron-regulated membrane protein